MANLGYIQVTRQCNQLCRFCSNPPSGIENTLETACGHVDDFVARGYHGIILTGGEPTMVPWLADLVRYAMQRDMHIRVITNGQFLGEGTLLQDLVAAGLRHVHVSRYSCRPELQDELSRHPGSHANIVRTLETIGARDDITADINCVINHFNAGELDLNVRFILERFPFVRHFVWNNLDPRMNRVAENPDTVPKLWEFELSLYRAMRLVDESGRTFRVERVPLCYMVDYAHCSTETRKIVKDEERIVHFLDQKGFVRQASGAFVHGKTDACKLCTLDPICAGLDGLGEFFDGAELYPVFVDPVPIIKRVRKEEDGAG
jgi:MoaA/NifB/PqqE/SkfB family radical SAM enzyme